MLETPSPPPEQRERAKAASRLERMIEHEDGKVSEEEEREKERQIESGEELLD